MNSCWIVNSISLRRRKKRSKTNYWRTASSVFWNCGQGSLKVFFCQTDGCKWRLGEKIVEQILQLRRQILGCGVQRASANKQTVRSMGKHGTSVDGENSMLNQQCWQMLKRWQNAWQGKLGRPPPTKRKWLGRRSCQNCSISRNLSRSRGDPWSWHFEMELDPFVNVRSTNSPNVQRALAVLTGGAGTSETQRDVFFQFQNREETSG